jgi:hypothetical protein
VKSSTQKTNAMMILASVGMFTVHLCVAAGKEDE